MPPPAFRRVKVVMRHPLDREPGRLQRQHRDVEGWHRAANAAAEARGVLVEMASARLGVAADGLEVANGDRRRVRRPGAKG